MSAERLQPRTAYFVTIEVVTDDGALRMPDFPYLAADHPSVRDISTAETMQITEVLDADNDRWICTDRGLWHLPHGSTEITWDELLSRFGPVRPIGDPIAEGDS